MIIYFSWDMFKRKLWKNIKFFIFLPRSLLILRDTVAKNHDNVSALNAKVNHRSADGDNGIIDYNWIKFQCSRMQTAQQNIDSMNRKVAELHAMHHNFLEKVNELYKANPVATNKLLGLPDGRKRKARKPRKPTKRRVVTKKKK